MTDAEHLRWTLEAMEGIRKTLRGFTPTNYADRVTKSHLVALVAAGLVGYKYDKRRSRQNPARLTVEGEAHALPEPTPLLLVDPTLDR